MRPWLLTLALLFVCGCAHRPDGVAGYLVPQTVSVGLTAPNLVNGPVASASRQDSAPHNPLGQIGIMVVGTWQLVPIRLERAETQPVRIVPPVPRDLSHPIPTPAPSPVSNHGN